MSSSIVVDLSNNCQASYAAWQNRRIKIYLPIKYNNCLYKEAVMLEISKDVLSDPLTLFQQFEVIEDPRIDRHKRYPLINILIFAFVAILSDQQSWYQIFAFAQANLNWFNQFIDTSSGVPSHDTFRRVFSLLNPVHLEEAVIRWTENTRLKNKMKGYRLIILDGKALKGVAWKINDGLIHLFGQLSKAARRFSHPNCRLFMS